MQLRGMLKRHGKCTNTTFKLIQMRAEDNQRQRRTQNPMPSPRRHTRVPIVIFMWSDGRRREWGQGGQY